MTRRIWLLALCVATLDASRAMQAQAAMSPMRTLVTTSAVVAAIDHSVDAGAGVERTAGPVFGIQVDATRGPDLSLSIRGLGGTLDPRSGVADQRDLG